MALVPQDSVQLMLKHLNVGVCVCWVLKPSLESRCDYLTSPCTSVCSKVSCFVRALLARSQVVHKRSTNTFSLVPLSETDLAHSDGLFICGNLW